MTRVSPHLIFGLAMGLMLPFVLHGQGLTGAILFIAVHLVVLGIFAMLVIWVLPRRVTNRIRHRPSARHMIGMAAAMMIGGALVCAYCLLIEGTHA